MSLCRLGKTGFRFNALHSFPDDAGYDRLPHGHDYEFTVMVEGQRGAGEMLYSGLYNVLGIPALALPAGLSEGLPAGLQIATPWGADSLAFSVGAAIEAGVGLLHPPV